MPRLSLQFSAALLLVLAPGVAGAVAPQISSITPPEGSSVRACCITINGSEFGTSQSQRSVTIGGVASDAVSWSGSTRAIASIPVPGTPGAAAVQVLVDGLVSNALDYTLLAPPTLDPLSPPYAVRKGGPILLTVTGSNFGVSAGTPRLLTISGLAFGATLDPTGGLVADVSALDHSDAARSIDIDIDGQVGTLANAVAVLEPPQLGSVTPTAGRAAGGSLITIVGDHFGPRSLVIPHIITIAGASFGSIAHLDNGHLTGATPATAAGTYPLYLSMDGVAAGGSVDFQFLAPPSIASVVPNSGALAGGYPITIVGMNFGPDDAALPREIKVGGKSGVGPVRWMAPEVLSITVPPGDGTGPVDLEVSVDGVSTVLSNGFTYSGISGAGQGAPPARLELAQNGPNPFAARAGTEIGFSLPAAGAVALDLFDTRGRHVARLISGTQPAGAHSVRWDGRDDSGRPAPSGIYLYRLRAGGRELVRRMSLVR